MTFAPPSASTPPPGGDRSREAAPGYTRVAEGIRAMIVEGSARPGSWLRLHGLAGHFGVSVQPVREALQLLQGEGLVDIHPNRGAQVRGIDRRRFVHIYEIRAALESFMARQFADEASRSEIRALEGIQQRHDAANDASDITAILACNAQFHSHINSRGGNAEALALVQRYYGLSLSIWRRMLVREAYRSRIRAEHHALLEAFRGHDPERAAEIGLRHVFGSLQDVLTELDGPSASLPGGGRPPAGIPHQAHRNRQPGGLIP
jgi:DNA-binding GntR family transcriptional regulator